MSDQEQAAALEITERHLKRLRKAGLPEPKRRESLAKWKSRADAWREANRKRPGPRAKRPAAAGGDVDGLERGRLLRAELLELQVAERRGELHSTKDCEAAAVKRLAELRNAFVRLPDQLARALYQAASPDAIKRRVEEELRRIFEVLSRD
jgi:hypothetical protein